MGAPAHTTRTPPTGYKMPEGFKSTLAIAGYQTVQFWERDLKPPSIDGGDLINTTTQFNAIWETFFSRRLKKVDDITLVAAYDPDVYATIINIINVNLSMTFYFPSGDYVDFYGAIKKWEPGELKIGEFPTATVTIGVTNTDPSTSLEQGPVYTAVAGT